MTTHISSIKKTSISNAKQSQGSDSKGYLAHSDDDDDDGNG